MGSYTEFLFRAELVDSLPADVEEVLDYLGGGNEPATLPDHEFFKKPRWFFIGRGAPSAYFPGTFDSRLGKPDEDTFKRTVAIHCHLKNYSGEVEAFLEWVRPYIGGFPDQFIGYSLTEDQDEDFRGPTIHFKGEGLEGELIAGQLVGLELT